jgi:hypothetical protein
MTYLHGREDIVSSFVLIYVKTCDQEQWWIKGNCLFGHIDDILNRERRKLINNLVFHETEHGSFINHNFDIEVNIQAR